MDCRQHARDQEYTIGDSFNLCKTPVGITGTNGFGNYDPNTMYDALLEDAPFLEPFDGLTDQYAAERIKKRLPHRSAGLEVKDMHLVETIPELGIGVGSSTQGINDITEGYCMVEISGKSCEDTQQTSAADTANLGEESLSEDEDLDDSVGV